MMPKSMAPRAHEVGADPVLDHAGDREQHRQGDDAGGDEGGAEVAQHQEQHDDDQDRAFDQVLLDRPDRRLDQPGAVVDRARHDAVGQRRRDLVEPRRDALRGRPAVVADQQHGGADHGFLAVERGGTRAQRRPLLHLGHVADADRQAAARADDDVADLADAAHLPRRAHQVLLAVALDVACADVGVVRHQGRHDVAEGESVGDQPRRIGQHMELPLVAADRVDLDDAGHGAKLRLDDPVLDGAQVGRAVGLAGRLPGVGPGLDGVHVDLAQARRDRAHRGMQARRQLVLGLLDALVDELAGEVDVGAVLEHHGHLAEAVTRQRARVVELRQAAHRRFHRKGDALLDFQRRVARRDGVDLHLDVGDVGHRVDRQAREVPGAQGRHRDGGDDDQPAIMDREGKDAVDHRWPSPPQGEVGWLNAHAPHSPCRSRP